MQNEAAQCAEDLQRLCKAQGVQVRVSSGPNKHASVPASVPGSCWPHDAAHA